MQRNQNTAWVDEGLVPTKLPQAPQQLLRLKLSSGQKLNQLNEIVDTADMLHPPELGFSGEPRALYTVMLVDEGIERLQGKQYFHWLVENIPSTGEWWKGEEVFHYFAPFSYEVTQDGKLDKTKGSKIHPILGLLYKQKSRIRMTNRQSGCNEDILTKRIGDKKNIAEQYELELVAGTFFYTTYSSATDVFLCLGTRCSGDAFPFPIPGVNDLPICSKKHTTSSSPHVTSLSPHR